MHPLAKARAVMKYFQLIAVYFLLVSVIFAQTYYTITGQILNKKGEPLINISLRLINEENVETQNTLSSLKQLGNEGGDFEFKNVLPGPYFIAAEMENDGPHHYPLELIDTDLNLGKISLIKQKTNTPERDSIEIIGENERNTPGIMGGLSRVIPGSPAEKAQETETEITGDTLIPLPHIRNLVKNPDLLLLGTPFFNLQTDIKKLQLQMDSLKNIIKIYDKNKGLPTIDEELVNLIKVPEFQHRIELANGTIIIGEIIDRNDLRLVVQTSIGQLAIDMNKVENIKDTLPPRAKVKLVGDPFVEIFSDREEISGLVKNVSKKRADFVRVIVRLWSGDTELIEQDSVFVNGSKRKYQTGIRSDTAMRPGSTAKFKLIIPLIGEKPVEYRTYEVHWEQTK